MGFLDRFRRRPAAPAVPAAPAAPAAPAPGGDAMAELLGEVRELIAPGFWDRSSAVETIIERVEDDPDGYPGLSSDDARRAVDLAWAELASLQTAWPDEGDYLRLLEAFSELGSDGVVARMDFTCCQTCGHTEIHDERRTGDWGYTFFHQQDSERLVGPDASLYLAFGAFPPGSPTESSGGSGGGSDDPDLPVARRVVAALERQRLQVRWDGTSAQRIEVMGLEWRKKLPVG
jgi:hypothetical protein